MRQASHDTLRRQRGWAMHRVSCKGDTGEIRVVMGMGVWMGWGMGGVGFVACRVQAAPLSPVLIITAFLPLWSTGHRTKIG